MNAVELLANTAQIVGMAREWSEDSKLRAAIEILSVLCREKHLALDPDQWEFVSHEEGGFLRGPSPLNSVWAITGTP